MSYSQLGQKKPKASTEAPKRNVKRFLNQGKHGKLTADNEESPLLGDSAGLDVGANDIEASEGTTSSLQQKAKCSFQDVLIWILEILAIVILACLLAVGTIAVCVYGVLHHHEPSQKPSPICTTPGCVLAASELLNNISPNYKDINPCDDFHTYVCEGWDLKHDIRDDQSAFWTGTLMDEASQVLLRHVLESPFSSVMSARADPSAIDEENFEKLQNAYDACMDLSKLKERNSAPLLEVLEELEDIFPVVKAQRMAHSFPKIALQQQEGLSYSVETPLSKAMSYLMGIGVDAMLAFDVTADDKDPDSTVVMLRAPYQAGLPAKEYYNDTEVIKSYKNVIGQVLEALLQEARPNSSFLLHWQDQRQRGPDLYVTNEALVESIINYEAKIAEASPNPEDAFDVTKYYNPRSLEEARALIPQISIPYLISRRSSTYIPTKVIVGSPSYLEALSKLLSSVKKETIQAYLVWKTVQYYGKYIESEALKPLKRFNNQLQGKDPNVSEERWRTCVKYVDGDTARDGLGWILSRFYIEKAFSKDAKNFGDLIVSDIKDQFITKLNAAEWMSKDVIKLAINKVHNIDQKIGYPTKSPDIRDPGTLREYYKMVNISKTAFFENTISIAVAGVEREWSKAGKPTDRDEWGMTASTVNAYYNPPGNEIVFPAGIMQSPVFYDPSIPQYLSYGAFGSVSGHELSHAFDSSGRQYDQAGNYTDWWDNSTIKAFKEKAECFVEQYNNYTIPGPNEEPLHINGRLTLGENIADAGGLTASFQAWKAREHANPGERLPGLQNFTKEQLFFMSYSNWWCGKVRKEKAIQGVRTDPHSPFFLRILGTMANSREFKESFQCKEREPVCELW